MNQAVLERSGLRDIRRGRNAKHCSRQQKRTPTFFPALVPDNEDQRKRNKSECDVFDQACCHKQGNTPEWTIPQEEVRREYDKERDDDVVVNICEILQHHEWIPTVQVEQDLAVSFRQEPARLPQ